MEKHRDFLEGARARLKQLIHKNSTKEVSALSGGLREALRRSTEKKTILSRLQDKLSRRQKDK